MSAIYNPDTDEITTQRTEGAVGVTPTTSPSASTSEIGGGPQGEGVNNTLPGVQSQIDNLNAQRKAELDHIDTNYNQYLEQYDTEGNAIEALSSTVKKRKVIDPEQMRIRRNIANLYDALQLTGSLAGMAAGGRGTIGTPVQLSSAAAAHNTLAQRLQEQQRQADQDYTTQLANMTHRQQTARADIAKQRRQAKTEADRMRLNTNKHYDTQATRILEGERNRQNRTRIAIERNATAIKQTNIRAYGGDGSSANKYDLFDFDGSSYRLPANMRKDFSSAVGNLVNNSDNAIYPEDFTRYGAKLSGTALHMAILRAVLNGDIQVNANTYQDALSIFETYFTPVKQPQQPAQQSTATTKTKTNIPGFSASTSTTGKKTIPGF